MSTLPNAGRVPAFTLGDRLRKARELTGDDRKQFAARVGIHRETIMKYETDRQIPRPPALAAWSMATGVDLGWLQHGDAPGPDGTGGSEPPAGIEPATYSLLVGVSAESGSCTALTFEDERSAVTQRAA